MILFFVIFFQSLTAEEKTYEKYARHIANQFARKIDIEQRETADKLSFLIEKMPKIGGGCERCRTHIENFEDQKIKKDGIIVFVSFSMPKEALRELSEQAEKYGATLVMRGIFRNSFRKTKDKISEIGRDGLKLNIDPQMFKKYGISRVPTFVLVKNDKEIARLSGQWLVFYNLLISAKEP